MLTEEKKDFYKKHGIDTTPNYMGQTCDKGKIEIEPIYPGEGYAIIKCGGTEIKVGYSILHHVRLDISGESSRFAALCALQDALFSITCEAQQENTGD